MGTSHRRVVWYEGMALDPQHLQQSSRHTQSLVTARARTLSRYDWGLTRLDFDRDRLPNGELAVPYASGVMPDGLVFDYPDQDGAPAPRSVAESFPPTSDRLAVFLAVPSERPGEPNVARDGGASGARREIRFASLNQTVPDDNAGHGESRAIEVAIPNFQLRFDGEPMEGYTAIRVAEIVRTTGGSFAFDNAFIPTVLRLSAAPALEAIGQRLQELLVAQRATLAERRLVLLRKPQLTPADVTALHLYEVVCAALPRVTHCLEGEGTTPEDLYLTMADLAARLAAWVPSARIPEIHPYEHSNLTRCFGALAPMLWELLGGAAPDADYVEVQLKAVRANLYVAQTDEELLNNATWYLTVATPDGVDDGRLVGLADRLRVASPQTIDSVLRSATRALTLTESERPPANIPFKTGARVLALGKRGPFWEAILQDRGIAVYVPAEMGELQLSLLAVLGTA